MLMLIIVKVTEHKQEANFHMMCNLCTVNMQDDGWRAKTPKILNSPRNCIFVMKYSLTSEQWI